MNGCSYERVFDRTGVRSPVQQKFDIFLILFRLYLFMVQVFYFEYFLFLLLTFLFICGITRVHVYIGMLCVNCEEIVETQKSKILRLTACISSRIIILSNTEKELKAMKMCDIQRVATSIDESIRNCDRGNTLLKEIIAYMGGDAESVLELIAHNWWGMSLSDIMQEIKEEECKR